MPFGPNGGIGPVSVVGHVHGKTLLFLTPIPPRLPFGRGGHGKWDPFLITIRLFFLEGFISIKKITSLEYIPLTFGRTTVLTVYGSTGYVWAECNGHWGAFTAATNGAVIGGKENGFHDELEHPFGQTIYTADLIRWLVDDTQIHPVIFSKLIQGMKRLKQCVSVRWSTGSVDLPMKQSLWR